MPENTGFSGIWWRRRRDSNPRTAQLRSNGLANRPLQPTWVLLHEEVKTSVFNGGESEIRTHGRLAPTPVFKTGALNQLDHLSSNIKSDKEYFTMNNYVCQHHAGIIISFL